MCGSTEAAHRYAYRIHKSEIPKKMIVCHSCDNRRCVNPDHLWIGTHQENTKDMIDKNRDQILGEKNCKAKLSEREVLEIYCLLNLNKRTVDIADFYGINRTQVQAIKSGNCWKNLYDQFMNPRR